MTDIVTCVDTGRTSTCPRACRDAGFEPDVHASRFAYAHPPLRSGEMFALTPALPGQPWTADAALVPLGEPAPTISFHLVWRDAHDPAVDAFVSAARRVRARRGWAGRS